MPGAFTPAAFRMGGSEDSPYKVILESLLEAYGSALSDDPDSYVYLEAQVEARALVYLWELTQRFANQFDPATLTDFLDRWVAIYGIPVTAGETAASKRAKVRLKMSLIGTAPTLQGLYDLLVALLGDVFVALHHQTADEAIGNISGGLSIPGGTTLGDETSFSSTIAFVGIELTQPASMTDLEFATLRRTLPYWLDNYLPAWVDWGCFVRPNGRVGFFLDEPNLSYLGFGPA